MIGIILCRRIFFSPREVDAEIPDDGGKDPLPIEVQLQLSALEVFAESLDIEAAPT